MRTKKGAALPAAIIVCFILLIVSYEVGACILVLLSNNIISNYKTTQKEVYATSYREFLSEYKVSNISDTTYTWKKFQGEKNSVYYVALAAYHSLNGNLEFYAIYDDTHKETVIYQTSNFYISNNVSDDSLWGLSVVDAEE